MKPEPKQDSKQRLDEVEVKIDGSIIDGKIYPAVDIKALKASIKEKKKQVKDNQIIRK
jgi:hypothetical protein